ncbi:hypothetical protein [Xanthomonas hortorum]|uniref:hypothetical protein n=1 Tax=Xanthomonas hortorum TaxID=56454 RepID=UPI002FE101C2
MRDEDVESIAIQQAGRESAKTPALALRDDDRATGGAAITGKWGILTARTTTIWRCLDIPGQVGFKTPGMSCGSVVYSLQDDKFGIVAPL